MDKAHVENPAASMAGEIKATVGNLVDDARSRIDDLASQATETADHVYHQVRDQVRGAATAAATSVERQPLIALVAVGFICGIVGFLLARR